MGLLKSINEKLTSRRLNRLRSDLTMLQKDEFEFNLFKVGLPKKIIDTSVDNLELVENIVWGTSSASAIRQFYIENSGKFAEKQYDSRSSYFSVTAPANYRYIHSGLPKLISETMANLIFGNGYQFNVNIYKDEKAKVLNAEASADAGLCLYRALDNINEKLIRSGTIESITGDVGWKLSYDFNLTHLPILEVFDRRNYSVIASRGIVQAIIFKSYYERKESSGLSRNYIYEETYTHDDNGVAMIKNDLYEIKNGNKEPVSLSTLEETTNLEPEFKTGFVGDMAFHKKNKEYSGLYSNYPYGESDYTNKDAFDGMDEALSQIIAEIRDNKTIRFFDETYLPKDEQGNFTKLNSYVTSFLKVKGSQDQNAKAIEEKEFNDKTEQHIKKYKTCLDSACAYCKISPISLGLTGEIGIASSDETLRERTAISRETATKKKALWTEFLNSVFVEYLKFAKYLTTLNSYPNNPKARKFKELIDSFDVNNIEMDVKISPYDVKSIEDKINTWSGANQSGVASIETAVQEIYGDDWDQKQIDDEVNRIKIERNITLDDPEMLSLNDFKKEDEA